jgi:hypothetical protein
MPAKKLHVANSALTNTIFAGHVLKDGRTWGANKQDVTGEACAAVAQHVLAFGEPVIVSCEGQPRFEICVRNLQANNGLSEQNKGGACHE